MLVYEPIHDPFISKAPIGVNRTGFYPRDEVFINIVNSLRAGDSISLVGERKAGKTSFLNYLLAHSPSEEFIPVFVDTQYIAPQTDQIFLGWLIKKAAQSIAQVGSLIDLPAINTLTVEPKLAYLNFQEDIERLRSLLPVNANGQKRRLIWLIDEIETLRGYAETELFTFLRPLAQTDPDFRLVIAGYDILYTLSSQSEWSPFFNAFTHIRLEGLNPISAQQLIDDALATMKVTIESDLYQSIFQWTGKKPYYLKWMVSRIAEALNQRRTNYHIEAKLVQTAQTLFLSSSELDQHFAHLWNTHTTPRQQTTLSLLATQTGPYNYPTVLNDLKKKRLIQGDTQATQHLIDDLTRLTQLGFLYERTSDYTFTSGCLQAWVKKNKPLDE